MSFQTENGFFETRVDNGEVHKAFTYATKFKSPPGLTVSLNSLRANTTQNFLDIDVYTSSESESGFTVYVKSAESSNLERVRVQWTAIGESAY